MDKIKPIPASKVIKALTARHVAEMVVEGEANISMTTDLVIYFPIEIFNIKHPCYSYNNRN